MITKGGDLVFMKSVIRLVFVQGLFLIFFLGPNGSGFHFLFFQLSSGIFLISGFLISETACIALSVDRGSAV